jgi:succinylglutamate desuccinylase
MSSYYITQQLDRMNDPKFFENSGARSHMNRPIVQVIKTAYQRAKAKNWDTLYWAIDIHETITEPTHQEGVIGKAYPWALETMWFLLQFPETRIILWSSMSKEELARHRTEFFDNCGLPSTGKVFLNENPEVGATKYANFDQKMYMNMLLDDKAGFDPKIDWATIIWAIKQFRISLNKESQP